MIIVTGATGQLGSKILDRLLESVAADEVGVSVRDVEKAAALADRGVRVRRGDYTDPESLASAFEGASQVLVVSSNASGDEAVEQHCTAIDAARAAGAERVLYTSHQGAGMHSLFHPMPDHAATEQYLAGQGGTFTSLRNGFYASSLAFLIGEAAKTGSIIAPADAPVSWTTQDDLAAVAALVLREEGRLDGITAPLTAPVAVDLEDVAGVLSDITGRTVTRVVMEDEDYRARMTGFGLPAGRVDFTLGLVGAIRAGEFNVTDPTLEALLGRPAQTVRTVLEGVVAAQR